MVLVPRFSLWAVCVLVVLLALPAPVIAEELVYADPHRAPDGHGYDTGYIVTFRRL